MRKLFSASLVLSALVLQSSVFQSQAQVFTLTNNNSLARINVGSQAGMFQWQVQGLNQLVQQWFWYRVGPTGPEAAINSIGVPVVTTPDSRNLSSLYTTAQFSLQIDYKLTGGVIVGPGGTAASDMAETITINNLTANPLDFHFFQYSDFDLGGPGQDTVTLGKIGSLFYQSLQTDPFAGLVETVNAPGAIHGEAGLFPSTINKLNNGVADNLNDVAGPVGPGDATWALQWDFIVDPFSSKIISKDKNLLVAVPEPGTWALISAGLVVMGALAFRRRKA